MDHSPTISVTLSADLLKHLRRLAEKQYVPISWLVTGLICETLATCHERVALARTSGGRVLPVIRSPSAWN